MESEIHQGDFRVLGFERYLVFGAARSGRAAARLLRELGRAVDVHDEAPAESLSEARGELDALGAPLQCGPSGPENLRSAQAVILSPGIPARHALLEEARRRDIGVFSEVELGFACTQATIVGITGSNGKTTVTKLAADMFRAAGVPSLEAGNIGAPLCEVVLKKEARQRGAILSVELSSFQLETIDQFRPKAAIILNITPDHLDRYGGSIEAYAAAKARITMNQRPGDALIVNQDDARCLAILQGTQADPWTFSTERPVERGGFLNDEMLMAGSGRPRQIALLDEIPLRGMHNVSNLLAASCAASFLGLPLEAIRRAAREAQAPEHRLQRVATIDGVDYYNDSKATNIDAVRKALESFSEPVILLAGGRDKGGPFRQSAASVRARIKKLIVFGEAADEIARHWGGGEIETVKTATLSEAVIEAGRSARPGDVALLSPACASFDQYPNYEARGEDFAACVQSLEQRSAAR